MKLFGNSDIEEDELMEYIDERYYHLQEQIEDADMDEYEDQLRIVGWKDAQHELMLLARNFDLD